MKESTMNRFACILLLVAAAPVRSEQGSPAAIDLPRPTGPYAVGRVSYDWIDTTRPEVLAKAPNTHREIIVDVWYPAAPLLGASTAPYLPNAEKIEKSSYARFEEHWWRKAWPMVVSGSIHTRAFENASFVSGDRRFPLITFSHGYSVEPAGYTHQIEELVSHGYVIAAIHHTYEVAVTVFPDGRMIPFSVENSRGQDSPTIEAYRAWEKKRVDVWAADFRFTLVQIIRLNADAAQKAPFSGRIDIRQAGAFGHSFGGLAAARACSLDPRIGACINQNGVGLDGSIPHYGEGHMPAHPYLYFSEMHGPGSDTASQDGKAQHEQMEKELRECLSDTYDVSIGTPGFEHMSFADFSFLQATGNPEEPSNALKSLQVAEAYTIAFFDKFLKGSKDTLLDRDSGKNGEIAIKHYGGRSGAKASR